MKTGFLYEGVVVEPEVARFIDDIEFEPDVVANHLHREGASEPRIDTLRIVVGAVASEIIPDALGKYDRPSLKDLKKLGGAVRLSAFTMPRLDAQGEEKTQGDLLRHELRHFIQFESPLRMGSTYAASYALRSAVITSPVVAARSAIKHGRELGVNPLMSGSVAFAAGLGFVAFGGWRIDDLHHRLASIEREARRSEFADRVSLPDSALRIHFNIPQSDPRMLARSVFL